MAWIYLAESEDSPWPSAHGYVQSPIAKTNDTHKLSFCLGCGKVYFLLPQYGMTCELCDILDRDVSISSTVVSHARTSALQEMVRAWQESAADYSLNCFAWSAKLHPDSYFWRTSQPSGLEDFDKWSDHLPSSGSIVAGLVYPPRKSELHTKETGGSYLLPTPTALSYGTNKGGSAGRVGKTRPSLETMARSGRWSTPRASDGAKGGPNMAFGAGGMPPLPAQVGGSLSPMWVEWLMGFPIGWTELEDWVTQWFRSKRGRLSPS